MPIVTNPVVSCRLQHIAGEPRVLADHDEMLVLAVAETLADRPGNL